MAAVEDLIGPHFRIWVTNRFKVELLVVLVQGKEIKEVDEGHCWRWRIFVPEKINSGSGEEGKEPLSDELFTGRCVQWAAAASSLL